MYSARRSVPAVALVFVSGLCSSLAFSQSTQFLNLETRSSRLPNQAPAAMPCSDSWTRSSVIARENGAKTDREQLFCGDSNAGPVSVAPCAPALAARTGCAVSNDVAGNDLSALGKWGREVFRAHQKVLAILQTENACTAWYQTKEAQPAAAFQTLTFALDHGGDAYVRATNEHDGTALIRSPYVARVTQGGGSYTTITLNANGAFFLPMAHVIDEPLEGGPASFRGVHTLQVGPYPGGSFHAQVLTLLHEFGHLIDLLPADTGDHDGQSRQNTAEVLRFCRAELESKEASHTLLASQ